MIKCDCVILNYNDSEESVKAALRLSASELVDRIIIVDNCSDDDSWEKLQLVSDEKIEVIKTGKNGGYGYGNNEGIRFLYDKYHSKYIMIANPDTKISDEAIKSILSAFEKDSNLAIAAPLQRDTKGAVIKNFAWKVPTPVQYIFMDTKLERMFYKNVYSLTESAPSSLLYVDCVPGALLFVRTEDFLKVKGYDENVFLFCEETILGFKMKKHNKTTAVVTNQYYDHEHSVSINKSIKSELKKKKMVQNNRIYFLKEYMNISVTMTLFAKCVFGISNLKTILKTFICSFK